jgi:hypothetical protein
LLIKFYNKIEPSLQTSPDRTRYKPELPGGDNSVIFIGLLLGDGRGSPPGPLRRPGRMTFTNLVYNLFNFPSILLHCVVCITLIACSPENKDQPKSSLILWYDQPASIWEEALPLGNGKTGAMVFGGIRQERYQLNDNTLWSGYPEPGNNLNGPEYLPKAW